MKKVILLNGIITVAGFLLDIYGVFDLSLSPAIIGLTLGIVDCITFLWMREEIKATIRRWKAGREIVLPYWFEDMKRGESTVIARLAGRSVLNKGLYLAKKLGYEAIDVSESKRMLFTDYTVTFKKRR
ncbi:MAG: hypothetical protein NWF14_08805 [Candidatus Bathyarchaeota archaeon]|nr:hypothetical protein [Candidatus Bathyarchaeota archaeon]